jgi:hypothetical protein
VQKLFFNFKDLQGRKKGQKFEKAQRKRGVNTGATPAEELSSESTGGDN